MKSTALVLALLSFLGCSAAAPPPRSELEAMATRGLQAAITEVNSLYAVSYLYRPTTGSVKRAIPLGQNTNDLMLAFGIKETECLKASGSDPQTCAFRSGFFVSTRTCSSRVRVTAASTQVLTLDCDSNGSSSSESSEEVFRRGRVHFNIPMTNTVQAPPPPPPQSTRSVPTQTAEARPRGDVFDDLLV